MSKYDVTSSAANSFGAGKDLVGMSHKGHEVVSASRKYMELDNGDTVARAGNIVEHQKITSTEEMDNSAYMTDDL